MYCRSRAATTSSISGAGANLVAAAGTGGGAGGAAGLAVGFGLGVEVAGVSGSCFLRKPGSNFDRYSIQAPLFSCQRTLVTGAPPELLPTLHQKLMLLSMVFLSSQLVVNNRDIMLLEGIGIEDKERGVRRQKKGTGH